MNEFFQKTGKVAIGSRLRMLSDRITDEATRIYGLYGAAVKPKWYPVFFVLNAEGEKTVTEIAEEIGHSHPSVSKILSEMEAAGLVKPVGGNADGRRKIVGLTSKGKRLAETVAALSGDVAAAVEKLSAQTRDDLWRAIEEWEFLLEEKPLFERVKEAKRARERRDVEIVGYEPRFHSVFKKLNAEWIEKYFRLEAEDVEALDDPKGHILEKGGHIFVALCKGEAVGVCALKKMDDPVFDFELAKLAVRADARGLGIGLLLGEAVIAKARELGGRKIFLESNTVLVPAINLYKKLGFRKIVGRATPYARSNIQMALDLVPAARERRGFAASLG